MVHNLKADNTNTIINNIYEEKSDSGINNSTGDLEVIKPEFVYYKRNFSSMSLNKDNYGNFNSTAESFYSNRVCSNINYDDFFGL